MAGKSAAGVPDDKLKWYEKLVATRPDVARKGASMPYTSLGGHMFSFLTPAGTLALRLPADVREAFLKKYKTRLCQQHGRVMQEYVEVPDKLLKNTQALRPYFDASAAFVKALPPKPTTRGKEAGKKTKR
jgi:hypothetical protein